MNIYKKSIFLSLIAASVLPVAANAEGPQVYGKLHLALERIDNATEDNSHWDLSSHASRFGVKGDFNTDTDSLKVIYQLEWEVDVTDDSKSSEDHIKSRNQYLGLKGNFGQLIAGRHDTPLKSSQGKLDQFGDSPFDIKYLMKASENRESNIIQYTSPKIGDRFSVSLMAKPGEESDNPDPDNGIADGTSASIAYDSDSLHVALAFESDIDGRNVDSTRFVATWKHGNFGLGGLYQTTDFGGNGIYNDDEEVFVLSGFYKINKIKLKAQFGQTENYAGNIAPLGEANDADYAVVGFDYSLSKKTTVGAYYGSRDGADKLEVVTTDIPSGLDVYDIRDQDVFGVNLIHKF